VSTDNKKYYRALISVPVFADDDSSALDAAVKYAHSLQEDDTVIGHLESIFEVADNSGLAKGRNVYTDPGLAKQI